MRYAIPAGVQQAAKRALSLRERFGRGGTEVGLGTARRLARGGAVPFEFVKKVSEYFPRHAGDRLDDPSSNGSIAWGLWGGDAGRRWSEGVMGKRNPDRLRQVAFTVDKQGRPRAYRVSLSQMRNFPIGYDEAKLMVSTGEAKEVPFKPFGKRAPAKHNPSKLTVSELGKRITSAGRMDGADHRGRTVDPSVVDEYWKRHFVVHGLGAYGEPVQRAMRDEYETAFWRGVGRGIANPAAALQYIATFNNESEAETALAAWADQEGFIGGKVFLDETGKHGQPGRWVMQGFLEDAGGGAHGELPDGVRRVLLLPAMRAGLRNPVPTVTDRALRYRANANPPAGPKLCLWCGSRKNVEVGHLDGHEENNTPENLHWTCRSCNTALGHAFKKLGIGRRTRQYNPAGAETLGQWLNAVMSAKGEAGGSMDVDSAVELIRYTSPVKRSEFSREIWEKRRRAHGPTGRRNPVAPDITTSSAIKKALAKLTEAQRHEVVLHGDRIFYAMLDEGFDSKKAAELSHVAALNKAHALSLTRRNPEDTAAALYEEFHGKPSGRVELVEETVHYHEHLAGLGQLISLKIKTPTKIKAELTFAEADRKPGEPLTDAAPLLACSEDGRQLYIVGGDQSIDLSVIEMDRAPWLRESMNLGEILVITYRTQKGFHNFEDTDYFHHFSEDSGNPRPVLMYDTRNKALSIVGGSYKVEARGIVD